MDGSGPGRGRNRLTPALLVLEDRRLLSTTNSIVVNSAADTSSNPAAGTLRWAIQQAELDTTSPSTITFASSLAGQTIELVSTLELSNADQPVTIDGTGGPTINDRNSGVAFKVDANVTATITGLSLEKGNGGGSGAFYDLGNLTMTGCTLTGYSGAAINVTTSGTVDVTNCSISGFNQFGAGGMQNAGHATLVNDTFTDNNGADATSLDNTGTATLTDCTITGNSTSFGSGGLYNAGTLTVTNCTITGNTGGDGGVFNHSGTCYLDGTTISQNSSSNGGGIVNSNAGTIEIRDCTIESNTARGAGGGLYNAGVATLTDCTVSGNTAGSQGGGVANGPLASQAVLTITDSTLSGNTSVNNGGGVFNNGTATLTDDTIANNNANQGSGGFSADGGGLDNSGTATLIFCTISGNTASATGGGVYNGGLGPDKVTLTDTIVAGNTSTANDTTAASDLLANNGTTVSGSYNLIGDGGAATLSGDTNIIGVSSPKLGPLAANGGPTETMALLAGSPAIGAGTTVSGVTTDQRGAPLDTPTPDIGAYQVLRNPTSFSGLTNQTVSYGTPSVTLGGTIAAGTQVPAGENVLVTLDGDPQEVTIGSGGTFSATFETATLPASATPYTVTYAYKSDGVYSSATGSSTLTVTQATPTVTVADGGTYDGAAYAATGTVAGAHGNPGASLEGAGLSFAYYTGTYTSAPQLLGVTPLTAPPTAAGSYTVLASFPGSADYTPATALANFTIGQATPTLTVDAPSGPYGSPTLGVTATVAGVGGTASSSLEKASPTLAYYSGTYTEASQLDGLTPLSTAPTGVGSYTVLVSFPGSSDYAPATTLANFTIGQATPTVTVNDPGGTYGGTIPVATATVAGVGGTAGSSLEDVNLTLAYYGGTYTKASQLNGLTPLLAPPTQAGSYTAVATFPGSTDYAATTALLPFTIARANPTLAVSDSGGTYNGAAVPAAATLAGLDGPAGTSLEGVSLTLAYYSGTYTEATQLNGLPPLSAPPIHAGAYTAVASFPGSADYAPAEEMVDFTIAKVSPTITWGAPASIVFGTPISAAQLDATADVPGIFSYSPSAGAVLGVGAGQTLTVAFTPDDSADYTPGGATTTITVTPATPEISVSAPGGAFDGSPIAASVTLDGSRDAAPAASLENVAPRLTYYVGTGTSGTVLGSTPPSLPGTYTVVATFPGSADYVPATAPPVTFTIVPASTSVSVSGGSSSYGQALTFTATIAGAPASPGGTVTFYDDGTPIGTAPVDASDRATLSTSSLAVGTHAITAAYSGDTDLLAATSPAATETVTRADTQVVLVPQPVLDGKKVTSLNLEAKVQPPTPGAAVPTGTLTFELITRGKGKHAKARVKVLGTAALSDGSASLSVRPKQVLKKPITIIYGGDADFLPVETTPPALTKASLKAL